MKASGTVIVIPTRNRADLAWKSVESVLAQLDETIAVLVSDNSTSVEQRAELSGLCMSTAHPQLRYVSPPQPLPMTRHWDWAMENALSFYEPSHVSFLTDRMLFKPGTLPSVLEIGRSYPDKIITYMHDMVDDFARPVVVRQYTWTGDLYDVSSRRLLELTAESVMYDSAMPRMLNCLVPRPVLGSIHRRFGNYFTAVSPDWNFAFRALEVEDSIVFHDRAALVHHAQNRSNGQSAHYGIKNDASRDFLNDLADMPINAGAPYPEIVTVWNGIISEYIQVKQETQSLKFPEINLGNYLHVLAWGVDQIRDPERQDDMRRCLATHGWQPAPPAPPAPAEDHRDPVEESPTVAEFAVNGIEFEDPEKALQYALNHARPRSIASTHQALLQGVALAGAGQPDADTVRV